MQEKERLIELLKSKKDEYKMFGCTSKDIEQDNMIRSKIKQLRIKELEERISNNKFINDFRWRERGDQVMKDELELKGLKL